MFDRLEVPEVLFPASAAVPEQRDALAIGPQIEEFRRAAVDAVRELHQRLISDVLMPGEIRVLIAHLNEHLRQFTRGLESKLIKAPRADQSRGGRIQILSSALPEASELEIFGYVVYDEYFNVVRSPDLSRDEFGLEMVRATATLLGEISDAPIGFDEVIAILAAATRMLEMCWPTPAYHPVPSAPEPPQLRPTGSPAPKMPAGDDYDSSETGAVATFRWKVGHHFFAFSAMWCRYALEQARKDIKQGDVRSATAAIDDAACFLRATTAAMWYASCFPASVYVGIVRPQMEATETRGFSGSQNLDYAQMLASRDLLERAFQAYFFDPEAPYRDVVNRESLFVALIRLYETDIEDSEHHILIAAQRIGRQPSLYQQEMKDADEKGRPKTALDLLRDLGEGKRGRLQKLHDKVMENLY